MKWLAVGVKPEFVKEFKEWFKSNGIRYMEETVVISDTIHKVFYMPVGKEQKEKCARFIEDHIRNT